MSDTEATTEFTGAAIATVTVDIASLLTDKRFLGEDYDGDAVHSNSVMQQIVKAASEQVVKKIMTDEFRASLGLQISVHVAAAVEAALDREVQPTDTWGRSKGEPKPLRDLIADQATEEISNWTKRPDSYHKAPYAAFLRDVVDRAIREDVNGTVEGIRKNIKARMEQAGAEAIAKAAASLTGVKL